MIATSKFAKILLIVFACLHLVFAIGFAIKTPYRQAGWLFCQLDPKTKFFAHSEDIGAPDERQHANYIRALLKDHQLPVFQPGSPNFGDEYQSHQPPLYYLVSSALATVTGQNNVESQGFGTTMRLLNCLIGVTGIVGIFFAGLWSSKREEVAILAATFAAILPMNCALSGAISNDPLLISLISWSFAYCARAFHSEENALAKRYFMFGAIFAGLACITKSTGLVALVGVFVTAFSMRTRLTSKTLGALILIAIMIGLPIWIRNQMLYGDPLAQKAFKEAFIGSAQKEGIISEIERSGALGSSEVNYWINWFGYWVARSFIGAFGYMDIWMNSSTRAARSTDPNILYKILIGFIIVAKLGFIVTLRNNWKEVQKPVLTGVIMALLTLMLLIGFNLTYFQAQGRYLMPALAPIALILAIGWLTVFRNKLIPVLLTVVVLFGGTTVYSLSKLESEFSDRISGTVSPR